MIAFRKVSLLNDTAAHWATSTRVLKRNQLAIETDTGRSKWGDGTNVFSALTYVEPVTSGNATLVGGTVTVANASITANSIIRLAYKTAGGTPGAVFVAARSAGTSFTLTSTSNTDTSVIRYTIDSY